MPLTFDEIRYYVGDETEVALDWDDNMVDTGPKLNVWHNDNHGTDHSYEAFCGGRYEDLWGVPTSEVIERCVRFHNECWHLLRPHPGVREALMRLSAKVTFPVYTYRNERLRQITHREFELFRPVTFTRLVMCNRETAGGSILLKKGQEYIKHGGRVIVEDSISNAIECADAGLFVILVRHPHNYNVIEEELPESVYYARRGWEDVPEIFL